MTALSNTTPNRVQFHLTGRSVNLDRRVHAVRGDLADFALAGVLFAPHYARAETMHVTAPGAFVRGKGAADASAVSQLLHGEAFHLLDVTGGWAWGFCGHDGYVGYIERELLSIGSGAPNHRITALAAPVFARADIKSPVLDTLPCAALVSGNREGDFLSTNSGFIHLRHVAAIDAHETDWVAVAQRFLGQPYVWGGRGHGGLDCSGLVQVALGQCGRKVPRDTDLQRGGIGEPLAEDVPLQRGDIIFFPGHVGIMADSTNMIHANAFHMATVIEPLADVVERLKPNHEQPITGRCRITP
jgi:cell wall-associated NlpC family hydrolase